MTSTPATRGPIERRTIVRGAAWSLPVIAAAAAAPMAAASTTDLGALRLDGSCGALGVLGPGFALTAGQGGIPAGTMITIVGTGIANIGVFSVTGGTATVNVLSGTSRQVILNGALVAGQSVQIRTTLAVTVAFRLSGTVQIPAGYTATGAKTAGTVNSTLVLCSAT